MYTKLLFEFDSIAYYCIDDVAAIYKEHRDYIEQAVYAEFDVMNEAYENIQNFVTSDEGILEAVTIAAHIVNGEYYSC